MTDKDDDTKPNATMLGVVFKKKGRITNEDVELAIEMEKEKHQRWYYRLWAWIKSQALIIWGTILTGILMSIENLFKQ